jgi:putative Mn2+ efflux pump MntP
MDWRLIPLGIVIAANNMAVSLALGALGQLHRRVRIVAVFGTFESAAPLIGIWIGRQAAAWIEDQTAWLGPVLIAGVGGLAIYGAARGDPNRDEKYAR